MIQAIPKPVTFDEFVTWYPDGQGRYELHNGVIVEMLPTSDHEEVTAFLDLSLSVEINRLQLPYFMPRTYLVKSPDWTSGYQPDVIVLNREALEDDPLWRKSVTISQGRSAKLAIEVVSTNWRDDYLTKLRDYEEIGIPEYWIVDFKALGGTRYIGDPKRPTLSVYELVDGEYRIKQFRDDDRIESPTFPELNLTAKQIFQSGSVLKSNQ
jgi:Uma2 family endonuclease